jgi:hypothetical protein
MIMKPNMFIQDLQNRFPGFTIHPDDIDLPTVVFGFFSTYLEDALKSDQKDLVYAIVDYLGSLVASNNPIIESCLDEIALGIGEKGNELLGLIRIRNEKLYDRLMATILIWKSV